jgi:hypothetical protein
VFRLRRGEQKARHFFYLAVCYGFGDFV